MALPNRTQRPKGSDGTPTSSSAPSPSSKSDSPTPPSTSDGDRTNNLPARRLKASILSLPSEILQLVLSHLPPHTLAALSQTARTLHTATLNPSYWTTLLRTYIPHISSPAPAQSYRELYIAHHPYWFLVRQKVWYSDERYNGNIILVRFNPESGAIEGLRLLGEKDPQQLMAWSRKPSVTIHSFDPKVKLWGGSMVLRLPFEGRAAVKGGWGVGEARMEIGVNSGVHGLRDRIGGATSLSASFFLCRDIPEQWLDPRMRVWPPMCIPGMRRVRAESGDKFRGRDHKPQGHDEISETSFRVRVWSQFAIETARFGVRLGEEVNTWSTLAESLYTPTKQKPYQGIFVGDYAAHGCEFLLVLQTDRAPTVPERRDGGGGLFAELIGRVVQHGDCDQGEEGGSSSWDGEERVNRDEMGAEDVFQGAIEAIKLTGDVNVPRGEHTFIADDIGAAGFVRIAQEQPFRGARVVKSRGHVASRGFQDDAFVPSQLIMISPDCLAQFWVNMGHISYYRRVNIDDVLARSFEDNGS